MCNYFVSFPFLPANEHLLNFQVLLGDHENSMFHRYLVVFSVTCACVLTYLVTSISVCVGL